MHIWCVAFGGGLGALTRYAISSIIENGVLAVLVCNIAGSFLLAFFVELRKRVHPDFDRLVSVGFCGGLSVFASFSRNAVFEISHGRFLLFLLNVFGNFALCLLAILLAEYIAEKSAARKFFHPSRLSLLVSKFRRLGRGIFGGRGQ